MNCAFRFNHFKINVNGSLRPPAKHFQTQNCTFYANRTDIEGVVNQYGDEAHWILWRDSSCCNSFVRDTIIVRNAGATLGLTPFYSGSGTVQNGNTNITIDSCLWKVDASFKASSTFRNPCRACG